MKPAVLLLIALALTLAACSDSSLSQEEYGDGQQAARSEGCSCDPFISVVPASAKQNSAKQLSPRWRDGYINACVDLRRECKTDTPPATQ